MANWTLLNVGNPAGEKSFADWGLNNLVKTTSSQAQDIVTFTADGAPFDAPNLFTFSSTCIIKKNGIQWFVGRVTMIPRAGSPSSESMSYELAGPWWYLDNLVFQQTWKTIDGETEDLIDTLKSRIILNQDIAGEKLSTGEMISEVLSYAIGHGAPFQVGSVTPSLMVPFSEVVDRSCAEIIKAMLRWTPDAVTFFDYTTSTPTLHIKQRSACVPVSFPVTEEQLAAGINITPRYELQVPAVVLKFEQENSINDEQWTSVTVQTAGGSGAEFGALIMTIQLGGSHVTYQSQKVKTQAIAENDPAWWEKKLKWLADPNITGLVITDGQKKDSEGELSDKPREIIEGAAPSWKQEPIASEDSTEEIQVTAYFSFKIVSSTGAESYPELQPISCRVAGTTLNTKTYTQVTSVTEAEEIPGGLADSFYATLSVLQYDGTLVLTEEECGGEAQIGKLLNLTGGIPEWATMNAQIQGVTENVDSGATQIPFGPAEHLSPQDMVELLRSNRERVPSWRLNERTTGKASGGGGKVEGGHLTDNENASGAPAPMKKMVVASSGSSQFTADGGTLSGSFAGEAFGWQNVVVCDGGVEKNMKVLGTTPV